MPRIKKINLARKNFHTQLMVFAAVFALIGGFIIVRSFAASIYYISPSGNDSNSCIQSAPCKSFNRAYQVTAPGDTVMIGGGSYGSQVVEYRSGMANLPGACTTADTTKCVHFVPSGTVTINGILEIRGSSIWIEGKNLLSATGYIDSEAGDSTSQHPDHIIIEGTKSTTFGVFNTDTATFKNMEVGPGTAFWSGSSQVCCREGSGFENKIGFGGGNTFVPKNITLDGLRIHDQNGDSTRLQPGADVHFGGLFLVTADGLVIRNSIFERNVVYHIQIQNFGDAPQAKNVLIENNSFSCPVDWEYMGDVCDAQRAVQFDYDPGTEFTLRNNVASNGADGLYGCYVGSCGNLAGLIQSGNTNLTASTTAPPLFGGGTPAPTVSISASPAQITSGSSSTLSWNSANAAACSASGAWTGAKATSGTQVVSPTSTSTYTLICTGAGSSSSSSTTVTIGTTSGPPTISSFSPTSGPIGTVVTINGTNLDKATIVEFYRGDPVNFTINSPTKITAAVSPGSQTGYMSINQGQALSPQPFTVTQSAPKTGDLNSDGSVNILDLSILLSKWNTTDSSSDLNSDGSVNILDLSILLSKWGM